MTQRVPNLDLRFFATAVILQRQTGGDLAEILDKIGHLIRERFKIWGQIQALTGEGRLSGIVLLALPPAPRAKAKHAAAPPQALKDSSRSLQPRGRGRRGRAQQLGHWPQ